MNATIALLAGLCALTSDVPNLYTRVADKLAADPALAARLGQPGPEMASVSWLLGEWTAVGLDSMGNTIVTRGHARADGFVFEGDVAIIGVATHLRQTLTRKGANTYELENEERDPSGKWLLLDRYRYTRR